MKFKSFFLGMLGAAALVSCNNDNEIAPKPEVDVVEGIPVYATMSIGFANDAKTYAGTEDVASSTAELTAKDVAMYIYKADAGGSVPECAVYCAAMPANGMVTMKTTSGSKKIFVAVNPKSNPSTTESTLTSGFTAVSAAMNASTLFPELNNSIDATASGVALNTPAPANTKADGLIKHLAMNEVYGGSAGTYSGSANSGALMTNWDSKADVSEGGSATEHGSTVDFVLSADVDSVSSESHANNHININVQRAYAKVSVRITANAATGNTIAGCSSGGFQAAPGQDHEGKFYPWGSGSSGYWSLGNIPTSTKPFQTYTAGHVRDQWATMTDDSLNNNATAFGKWSSRYDNTRIYPTTKLTSLQNMKSSTAAEVKTTMTTAGNYTNLSSTTTADKFAYTTENAREHPVMKGHMTYVVVGGVYIPKKVITEVTRAAVITNPPTFTYNNGGADFSWTPGSDSLYYITDDNVFVSGNKVLQAYYAWAATQAAEPGAGGAAGGTVASGAATFGSAVDNAIAADRAKGALVGYFQGQCWYRVYVQNSNTGVDQMDQVIVARNHIYDVNITNIKGPGIADPGDIIFPGDEDTPVLEQDTYVSATINVVNWHKVGQEIEVDSK